MQPAASSLSMVQSVALPEFRREGRGYVYEPEGFGLSIRLMYPKRMQGDLKGELVVTTTRDDIPFKSILRGTQNVSGPSSKVSLAKLLAERAKAFKYEEWLHLVEVFCTKVLESEDEGEEVTMLGSLPRTGRNPFVVEKLLQRGQLTNLYAARGTGKGWLAIAIAVCAANGMPFCGLRVEQATPLYVDYEADQETFNDRVLAVCMGLGVPPCSIPWLKPSAPIAKRSHVLARRMAEVGATLLIVDSAGRAAGHSGEHMSWEDNALALSEALGEMGSPTTLLLDHISAAGQQEKIAGKAIGADRKMADARVAWEAHKAQEVESTEQHIILHHTKFNNTTKYQPLGFRLRFESDDYGIATKVSFDREDPRSVSELSATLPLHDQILSVLRFGAMTVENLADTLDSSQGSVRATCSRLARRGLIVSIGSITGPGRPQVWGLANVPVEAPKRPALEIVPTQEVTQHTYCVSCGDWLVGSLMQSGKCRDCMQSENEEERQP